MVTLTHDALFESPSPRDKFYDILRYANKNVVLHELDKLLTRIVALEALLDEQNHRELSLRQWEIEHEESVNTELNNYYLHLTSSILSQCE